MFDELLKKAMLERDMSQTQLSTLSGIGKSSISQYLSGKNVPNDKAKNKLADALGVSIEYFDGRTVHLDPAPDGIKNVTVDQAAKILGKSRDFIRTSLQTGKAPFGIAIKGKGDKWSYHISPKLFNDYVGIV